MKSVTRTVAKALSLLLLGLASQAHATCSPPQTSGIALQSAISPAAPSTAPVWSVSQVYTQGSKVQYNGLEYQARWWTQGNMPGGDTGEVWMLTVPANGVPQPWQSNQVYYGGEQTAYQGNQYSAKWWTKGNVPAGGSDWSFVRSLDAFGNIKLSGTYNRQNCAILYSSTYRTDSYGVTITWSISQDTDLVFAYWKQVDESPWKTAAQGYGTELARGTDRSGTMDSQWGDTVGVVPPPPGSTGGSTTSTTYSGTEKTLYLCSAKNECRKVISAQ